MAELNPHYISELNTGATMTHIQDSVDYPHTGLFKALMQSASGCFVVKNNTNDFDITQSGSNPVVTVAVGSYLDNGELKTTSGSATFNIADFTFTTSKAYYLIVIDSSGTVSLRIPTAANRVANHSNGDTIIAMLEIADDTAWGSRKIQFLTSSKTKNSLSVARDVSGVYTEMGSITGDANGILITGPTDVTLDGTNDRIYIKDATNNTLKTATPQSIADLSAYTSFNTDFDTRLATQDTDDLSEGSTNLYHTTARAISAVEGESTLDLTGALTVANGVVFNEAGASVDFRVESNNNVNMLVVDGSQDGVGINVAAPDAELHVAGVSKTKGLVVNLVEQVAAPPPFNTYDITDEDYIILASLDPIGNNLTLNLPSASLTRQGQIYRLILPVTGTGSLTIDVQSGDQLYDVTRTPVITPYEILSQTTPTGAAGDIWEVICLSGTEWMAYKL